MERHSGSPMLPLELFRSRTFSAVNLLTLLLYAALAGAFFFLPFAHPGPRLLGGACRRRVLPFTIIMALLSRWSGGLLDRFGARLPLVIGPTITALGFGLLALAVGGGAYWGFLVSITVLGLGMAISVAPLTTTVINAVPAHQTGVASGINNAVASLAGSRGRHFRCGGARNLRSRARPSACNDLGLGRGKTVGPGRPWAIHRTGRVRDCRCRTAACTDDHQSLTLREYKECHAACRRIGPRRCCEWGAPTALSRWTVRTANDFPNRPHQDVPDRFRAERARADSGHVEA